MLIIHIVIASLLIFSSLLLLAAGISRSHANVVRYINGTGLAGTFISGSILAVTFGGLGKFCVTMTAVTLAVVAVDKFYQYRLQPARVTVRSKE